MCRNMKQTDRWTFLWKVAFGCLVSRAHCVELHIGGALQQASFGRHLAIQSQLLHGHPVE
jgi:hypothetical protein